LFHLFVSTTNRRTRTVRFICELVSFLASRVPVLSTLSLSHTLFDQNIGRTPAFLFYCQNNSKSHDNWNIRLQSFPSESRDAQNFGCQARRIYNIIRTFFPPFTRDVLSTYTAMNPSQRPRRSSLSTLLLSYITIAFLFTFTAAQTYQGCYAIDSSNTLVQNDTSIYQSNGRCGGQICGPEGYAVFGMTDGSQCWCGNSIPGDQVSGDHCTIQCPGYPNNTCTPSS